MAGSSSTSSSDATGTGSQLHELRRFVVRLALFVLVFGALDFAVGTALRRMYFSQHSGQYAETTYILDRMSDPLVVVGSSRALHHYVPGVLAARLGRACYNAGRDGQGILFYEAMLERMFARYRPDIVILDLNARELEVDAKAYARLSELLPYVGEHPSLRRYADLRGPFERVKLLSRTYPFNSMVIPIVQHNVMRGLSTQRDSGYLALHDNLALRHGSRNRLGDEPAGPLDPVKRRSILHIVAMARAAGTRLCIIVSPVYSGDRAVASRGVMADLLREAGVAVWDYADDHDFRGDPGLFSDETHLNHAGATKFTSLIAARLAAER